MGAPMSGLKRGGKLTASNPFRCTGFGKGSYKITRPTSSQGRESHASTGASVIIPVALLPPLTSKPYFLACLFLDRNRR